MMENAEKLIRDNCIKLRSSGCTLEGLYHICFDDPERQMAEFTRDGADVRMTCGEVQALCEKAAVRLANRTGLQGQFIGLYGENHIGWIVLFWAILLSGNKPCLMNTVQPREVNRRMLAALRADTVVYTGDAPQAAGTEISFEELTGGEEAAEGFRPDTFGDEIAIPTSGTTLQEKICIFTGREISAQILNCEEIIRLNRDICKSYHGRIRMLMLLPLYHIFGLEATFLWFVMAGAVFVFLPDKNPASILRTIRDRQVTHVFAVPLFWNTVEKELRRQLRRRTDEERKRFDKAVRASVRLQSFSTAAGKAYAQRTFREVRSSLLGDSICFCITGGNYISDKTLELFNALGYPLCNGYGMSETGITSVELSRKTRDRIRNAIGKPFSSVRYRTDEVGRLFISGSSVCRKLYIDGQPAELDEWFNSGDIVSHDRDGRYYIRGRESDIVSDSAGEKLNPDVAERAFSLPWTDAFSVLGDEKNEQLIMVIRLPEGLVDIQKKQIEEAFEKCNNTLPAAYRIRKAFYTCDPIFPDGGIKVSRALLRRRLNDGSIRLITPDAQDGGHADDTNSDVKKILRGMIAEVLSIDAGQVRDDAHFIYDLGGTSLDYLSLISMIDNRFGVTLDFEGESSNYNLNDLTRSVEERLCC